MLTFLQWVDTESCCDGGNVRVSLDGGANWNLMDNTFVDPDYYVNVGLADAYGGSQSGLGWHPVTVDLSGYAGQTIIVRFAFYTDSSVNSYAGWYIDDVMIAD